MSRYGSISQFQGSSTGGYIDKSGGGGAPTSYVNNVIGASTATGAFGPPTLLTDQHCYVRGVRSNIIVEFISIELLPDSGVQATGAFSVTFNGACQPSSIGFETTVTPVDDNNNLYPYIVAVSPSGDVSVSGDLDGGEESRLTFTRTVPV